jgi:hypothetical protein
VNDPKLQARASSRSKDVTEAKSRYQSMKNTLQTLARNPDEPAANLEMGQFLCFIKANWDLGLRFLAKGADPAMKALADEKLATSKLYSIELSQECEQGALIPDELRSASGAFVPMRGKVEDFLKRNEIPSSIDMFLHDSSHSYRHMLWEFRQFWPRLRDGGLLVSHDVQMNAAFPEFVTGTYAHDKKTGRRDAQLTSHHEWGRWGYIGFAIKKS